MPPILTPENLGHAVLQSVEHGIYPDREDVASAHLPPQALSTLLDGIERAQDEVKAEIRALSRDAAPDIDGWIAQAKQLQADIERSRATAHDIVQQAEAGRTLQAHVEDASSKADLLRNELAFNDTLTATVERIKQVSDLLEKAQDAAVDNQVVEALDRLKQAEDYIAHLGPFRETRVAGVLQKRANQLRESMAENAMDSWNLLLVVDVPNKRVTINQKTERATSVPISIVVEALSRLGSLDAAISKFQKSFEQAIIYPRLSVTRSGDVYALKRTDNTIETSRGGSTPSVVATVGDVHYICEYLSARLPESVSRPLSERLMPGLVARLTSDWLNTSIPVFLDDLGPFQEILSSVFGLAGYIEELGWTGHEELREWVDKAPRNWLARRKEDALASVRAICSQGVQQKKEVERVETQMVSREEAILTGEDAEEDWDAWDNDEKATEPRSEKEGEAQVEEEDMDADAWGLDEDADGGNNAEANSDKGTTEHAVDDDADAWGWGDEDAGGDVNTTEKKSEPTPKESAKKPNGKAEHHEPKERELTLREKYTVTEIPDAIMNIITQIVSDAQALAQPKFSDSPIAPAGFGLYSIPTLILAMYRAMSPVFYTTDIAGNMLAYNDSTRLVDELRNFLTKQSQTDESSDLPPSSRPSSRLRLDADIKAIESFSKRAYGKEMESQRTILRDLLDSAQGFANCTSPPFAGECENAVSMTVDRIRDVAKQWRGVLSHSVLMQSLGSLLATVLNKMMVDIEDMSDISEEESKRLRDFCTQVSALGDLFVQEPQGDMTGVYTPNWFKFQYLGEILESSLADIKYLWIEGELKLEFEADEVVDLIEALFADSDYRRKAIADIRRTSIAR